MPTPPRDPTTGQFQKDLSKMTPLERLEYDAAQRQASIQKEDIKNAQHVQDQRAIAELKGIKKGISDQTKTEKQLQTESLETQRTSGSVLKDVLTELKALKQSEEKSTELQSETKNILERTGQITAAIADRLDGLSNNKPVQIQEKAPVELDQEKPSAEGGADLGEKIDETNRIAENTLGHVRVIADLTRKSEVWLSVLVDQFDQLLGNARAEKLERLEDRKELMDLLAKKDKGSAGPQQAQQPHKTTMGLGLLGALGGLLAGFAAELAKSLRNLFVGLRESIKTLFNLPKFIRDLKNSKLFETISASLGKVFEFTKGIFQGLFERLSKTKVFENVKTLLKVLEEEAKELLSPLKPVLDFMKRVGLGIKKSLNLEKIFGSGEEWMAFLAKTGKMISVGFGKTKVFLSKIGQLWGRFESGLGAVAEFFGKYAPKFTKLGGVLGKLAVPLTIILSAYDSIKAALNEFVKTGDWGKTIKAGLTGLLNSVVSAPLDLLKDVVAWIAGKFGFEGVKNKLDSFKVSDIMTGLIDRIVGWGKYALELVMQPISDAFQTISGAIKNGGIIKTIAKMATSVIMAPVQIMRNLLGSMAGIFSKDLKAKIDAFDPAKILPDSWQVSSTAPESPEFAPWTKKENVASGKTPISTPASQSPLTRVSPAIKNDRTPAQNDVADRLGQTGPVQSPFDQNLVQAYKETAQKKDTGFKIEAMKTAIKQAQEQKASQPIVVTGGGGRSSSTSNISSNVNSVTFNQNNIPDRTSSILMPAFGF